MDEELERLFIELDSLLDALCVHGADKAQEARQKLTELRMAIVRKMAAKLVHPEDRGGGGHPRESATPGDGAS